MDSLNRYREIIEQLLTRLAAIPLNHPGVHDTTVFDRRTDHYLVVREGWLNKRREHYIVAHLAITNGKIWIHADGTEEGLASQLEGAGVPRSDIVLGFQPPHVRPLTEYSAA